MMKADAVIEAAKAGDADALREMLAREPALAEARREGGETAVLAALYHGRREAVAALLEANPRLDIFEAAALGRLERVKELLDADPDVVNACAPDGFFPLGLACFFGHAETAVYLLSRGADVAAAAHNAFLVQPIHAATAARNGVIAAALLERGADPNARQRAGLTPLHAAADSGDEDLARMLLAYGADPCARDDAGATPLDLARARGHEPLCELLEARLSNRQAWDAA